jgi:hypothetical protein
VERIKILSVITDVIAIVEGLASLLFLFVSVVPHYINEKQLEAKTIRHCFFDVNENAKINVNGDTGLPAKPMKFTLSEKIATLKRKIFKVCCRCFKKETFDSWYTPD